jgi:hypothetical protein
VLAGCVGVGVGDVGVGEGDGEDGLSPLEPPEQAVNAPTQIRDKDNDVLSN